MGFKKMVYVIKRNLSTGIAISSRTKGIENEAIIVNEGGCKKSGGNGNHSKLSEEGMTQDLMRLVGNAIEEWAKIYQMDNLPKKIIFQQALTILNAMNKLFYGDSQKGDKMVG